MEGEDRRDPADKLEDLAPGFLDKLLPDAGAVPGAVRQLRGSVLEHDSLLHRLKVIVFMMRSQFRNNE